MSWRVEIRNSIALLVSYGFFFSNTVVTKISLPNSIRVFFYFFFQKFLILCFMCRSKIYFQLVHMAWDIEFFEYRYTTVPAPSSFLYWLLFHLCHKLLDWGWCCGSARSPAACNPSIPHEHCFEFLLLHFLADTLLMLLGNQWRVAQRLGSVTHMRNLD